MADTIQNLAALSDEPGSAIDAYASGALVFCRMFTRWMDGNGWSHPVMTKLARGCMGGSEGWLHSSQIANLRRGSTRNPGPRTFVAIERLNYYVWRYNQERALLPGSTSSNDYREAEAITEDGKPPSVGWFFEVFCGYRVPRDFDLGLVRIPPDQAELMSRRLGRLIRRLMMERGMDPVEDMAGVLATYTTQEPARLERVRRMTLLAEPLTADELEPELQNLVTLLASLGGTFSDEEALLREIRR